jgi:hypothetical protein
MRAVASLLCLLLAGVGSGIGTIRAAELPDARTAITRGLAFLAKEGDAWMQQKECIACHHLPSLLWSHAEAKRRGFAIDQAKMDEWIEWSKDRSLDSAKPKPGLEAIAQLLLAPRLRAELPKELEPASLVQQLVTNQKPDGSWLPGGQFNSMQRRAAPEAMEATARLLVLALDAHQEPAAVAARDKAIVWLKHNNAPQSTETLVYRVLMAKRFGTEPKHQELIKHQHADGGWAWRVDQPISDALATSEALYALHDVPEAKASVEKANLWLRKNQEADGSWPVPAILISQLPGRDHLKRTDAIYTFWASGWAAIALLQSQPVPQP